jgi:hypothetical protein
MLRRQRQSLQEHGNKKARSIAGFFVPEARLELAGEEKSGARAKLFVTQYTRRQKPA